MYFCDARVEIKNMSSCSTKKIILNSMENTMIFHRPVFRKKNFVVTSTKDSVWSFSLFLTFGLHKAYFSLMPKL